MLAKASSVLFKRLTSAAGGRMDLVRPSRALKWFGLQAHSPLPDAVDAVRRPMRHPAFDLKNPNRVRALIGSFAGNHLRFHSRDGIDR
jgi:aminopeptidase N